MKLLLSIIAAVTLLVATSQGRIHTFCRSFLIIKILIIFVLLFKIKIELLLIAGQSIEGVITNNDDGSVSLTATVSEPTNQPLPHSYTWTLPDGTVIKSGDKHGSFETNAGVSCSDTHT